MTECPQRLRLGPHFPDDELQERVKAYGARWYEEWLPPWTDEEDGVHYDGVVSRWVMKEGDMPDGSVAIFVLQMADDGDEAWPERLEAEMKLLDAGLARLAEGCS